MTNAPENAKKSSKVVRDLPLNEIEGVARNNMADDADSWGDEVDIPDQPISVANLDAVAEVPACMFHIGAAKSDEDVLFSSQKCNFRAYTSSTRPLSSTVPHP